MSKFKVGDHVEVVKNDGILNFIGERGTVIDVNCNNQYGEYGVKLDKKNKLGRTLGGRCEDGYGRWFKEHTLKLVERTQPIVIYRKGQEVIALNKNTGEKAIAKCHPDDEFNFEIGAKLAFDRLFNEKPDNEKTDEIKIGDTVKVVEIGATYSTYDYWGGLVVGDKDYRCSFILDKNPILEKKYTVVNKKEHGLFDRILYLIRDLETGQVFIIGDYGIKKI